MMAPRTRGLEAIPTAKSARVSLWLSRAGPPSRRIGNVVDMPTLAKSWQYGSFSQTCADDSLNAAAIPQFRINIAALFSV